MPEPKDNVGNEMKHPSPQTEAFVFNLGKASTLRCTGTDKRFCGKCDGCLFQSKIKPVKSWLCRAGDQAKRRFMLGLLKRLHSADLVKYVVNLLQPLSCKDFMYARSRSKPSLATDTATMSNDRALNVIDLEKNIAETWDWFQTSSYWIKANFLVVMLQECEQHLLHLIKIQANTLLTTEEAAFMPYDEYENESVASTVHSYQTDTRSELDLLTSACPEYSTVENNPFETNNDTDNGIDTPASNGFTNFEDEIVNDDSGDELFGEKSMFGPVDPTCLVVPGSSKAYSGVAMYKDFIRYLPVHLSKCILGMLDQVSLYNCVCVSKNWRYVSEEVHKEYYINQHLQEEVMLMQGASAHGCNPLFAKDIDVLVPNIDSETLEAIRTGEDHIETTFKSEVSFDTAYSGYETRKIIMEERNVYCGAYNVMVLIDEADPQRVVHTDGGRLITLGSADRKVRLVDTETCHQVDPVITGHAGSIRCLALCEDRGFVISGSFDTSVRLWSLETGKCQKIFRGHRDTVLCLQICGNYLVSGAKDNMCKVWNMDTKKCIRTFKHRHAITAVSMSEDMVISGCEAGKVKVWQMATGNLIKLLRGHQKAVTSIKFDRWHIVTGSKDGYALAWSSQGNHKRALTALRHPQEVLSLEFMYLRIITGSADGKLRIWNMVTGQCLRIMRGNSRSDPILALIAIGNRITINTGRNLLVLNFEPVDHDYTLESDKMPPLVQYSKYSDAPVRKQPYPYVRANRMLKAGAGNPRIVYHDGTEPPEVYYNNKARAEQVSHSAKSLSRKSLNSAKRIQSATTSRPDDLISIKPSTAPSRRGGGGDEESDRYARDFDVKSMIAQSIRSVSVRSKPPTGHSRAQTAKSRAAFSTTRSGTQSVVSVSGFRIGGRGEEDSSVISEEDSDQRRRVSWAFEQPLIPQAAHMGLTETKTLLRSQIRSHGDNVPPDFVYLTVNTIHANMKPTEASKNMEMNRRTQELANMKRFNRPNSSPSRVDPRTKVPLEELDWEDFCLEQGIAPKDTDGKSVAESRMSFSTRASLRSKKIQEEEEDINVELPTTKIITEFAPVPVDTKPAMSLYDKRIKSSIPRARLIRPHTAKLIRDANPLTQRKEGNRPKSALVSTQPSGLYSRPGTAMSKATSRHAGSTVRPGTAQTHVSHVSSANTTGDVTRLHKKAANYTSSCNETTSMVPMLMYPADVQAKMAELRQARLDRMAAHMLHPGSDGEGGGMGNVSAFNGPMRSHVNFKLLTNEQALKKMADTKAGFKDTSGKEDEDMEKRQKAAWLLRVKGRLDKDYMKKAKAFAPEIREIKDPLAVI